MYTAIIVVFAIGYLGIALEHKIDINKTALALLIGVVCWVLLIFGRATLFSGMTEDASLHFVSESLLEQIGEISEILFFLLGAMTIVELIDAHEGFTIITDKIKITNRVKLVWALSFITFFLSAALDNLTTAIVMATLLKKIIKKKEELWLFAGMIIIAANAGGAWSPIGDVTTIMLWIGGQITTLNIVKAIFLPSLVCLVIPLGILSFKLKGNIESIENHSEIHDKHKGIVSKSEKNIVFSAGIGALLFVPIFKTITHLPPFMGILFGLSIMWILTELMHRNKILEYRNPLSIVGVIQRIDTPSILFFLGILMAVAALQTGGYLLQLSLVLDNNFKSIYMVNTLMGMYSLTVYPVDNAFWELLAYAAGTGGSILIIGSAAGVAIMGIFEIDFIWYLKRISLLALLGYLGGIATYMILN